VSARDIETTFAGATAIEKAAESLKTGDFDSLYSNWGASFEPASGYQRHPKAEVLRKLACMGGVSFSNL